MIPKIIHYCWFGSGEMSDFELECKFILRVFGLYGIVRCMYKKIVP